MSEMSALLVPEQDTFSDLPPKVDTLSHLPELATGLHGLFVYIEIQIDSRP